MTTQLRPSGFKSRSNRRYRFPLVLQTKRSDDWDGTVTWTTQETIYGDIQPRTGRIVLEGATEETLVTKHHIFTAWRRSLKMTDAESMRLRGETAGEYFYIESIEDLNREKREVEIVTTLRVEQFLGQAIVTHLGENLVTHEGDYIVTHIEVP